MGREEFENVSVHSEIVCGLHFASCHHWDCLMAIWQHPGFFWVFFFLFFCFCFFFFFFRATPVAYGGSQAKDLIGATATATVTWDLSRVYDPHHSSWQCQILNPLSEARNRTHNPMVPSWIRFHFTTTGTPDNIQFIHYYLSVIRYALAITSSIISYSAKFSPQHGGWLWPFLVPWKDVCTYFKIVTWLGKFNLWKG